MTHEVLMLIIGAAISLVSSVVTLIIQKAINQWGKLRIFYQRIPSRFSNHKNWGIQTDAEGELVFEVPMYIQFQNISDNPRIIRDFGLYAFLGDKEITKFIQAERIEHKDKNGIRKKVFGNSEGYSFSIKPKSIGQYTLEYVLNENDVSSEFDNLRIVYYDEKNKKRVYKLCSIEKDWAEREYESDRDWIELK